MMFDPQQGSHEARSQYIYHDYLERNQLYMDLAAILVAILK